MPAVEIASLRKTYGAKVAVDDVSFTVPEGGVFGLLGPNGAGKTTIVECLTGLRRADSGRLRVLGLDPGDRSDRRQLRRRVGVQLQTAALPDRLRAGEALALLARFYSDPVPPAELLDDWGLRDVRRTAFDELSGGQKQRLFLALALVGRPELVVLDEFTAGLDPAARRDTYEQVRRLRDRGVTVVLVTHVMEEAERLCDQVGVLYAGRLVTVGTPPDVRGAAATLDDAIVALTDRFAAGEPARGY